MKHDLRVTIFREVIANHNDQEAMRQWYCHQLGVTFTNMHIMEDAIIGAMNVCDKVKVSIKLGSDISDWDRIRKKNEALQASTLGNLINILERHGVCDDDVSYLRWVKGKRDMFVHRFFRDNPWPDEIMLDEYEFFIRRLVYLQIIFYRASQRIWKIFTRADLMIVNYLGDGEMIAMNYSMFDCLEPIGGEEEGGSDVQRLP